MRHSTIDLTMNVHTDPKLFDLHGTAESLPSISPGDSRNVMAATGTDNMRPSAVAPTVAITSGFSCKPESTVDTTAPTLSGSSQIRRNRIGCQRKRLADNWYQRARRNRDDRTAIELFLRGLLSWEIAVRNILEGGNG